MSPFSCLSVFEVKNFVAAETAGFCSVVAPKSGKINIADKIISPEQSIFFIVIPHISYYFIDIFNVKG